MHTNRDIGEKFVVKGLAGKQTLSGSVDISGSKNAALPALAASILFDGDVTYTNVPDIEDIHRVYELFEKLGAKIEGETINTQGVSNGRLDDDIAKCMRASIIFTGPLLARFNEVVFPHPGGCVIGERPIDIFIESFRKMGATVKEKDNHYHVEASGGLHGTEIFLPIQSMTVTETIMMAAVLANGTTTIVNAAMEPEIVHLANFLKNSGVSIEGAGTPTITIVGQSGKMCSGPASFEIPPDRLEAGSFLILGALCAEELHIQKCLPQELHALIERLQKAGSDIEVGDDSIIVRKPKEGLRAVSIKTHEYPGMPTDLQAPMVVFLTQTEGEAHVFETIFEGRLHYIQDLIRMGADIQLISDRQIVLRGPTLLHRRDLKSPDIRAGLAFLIAAAVARGTSEIYDIYLIDRGYDRIEEKLQGIGLSITREKI